MDKCEKSKYNKSNQQNRNNREPNYYVLCTFEIRFQVIFFIQLYVLLMEFCIQSEQHKSSFETVLINS